MYAHTFWTIDVAFISSLSGVSGRILAQTAAGGVRLGRAEIKYLPSKRVRVKSSSRKRVNAVTLMKFTAELVNPHQALPRKPRD